MELCVNVKLHSVSQLYDLYVESSVSINSRDVKQKNIYIYIDLVFTKNFSFEIFIKLNHFHL